MRLQVGCICPQTSKQLWRRFVRYAPTCGLLNVHMRTFINFSQHRDHLYAHSLHASASTKCSLVVIQIVQPVVCVDCTHSQVSLSTALTAGSRSNFAPPATANDIISFQVLYFVYIKERFYPFHLKSIESLRYFRRRNFYQTPLMIVLIKNKLSVSDI